MSPLKRSHNVAARMGRWSARHRKLAIFGWLGFENTRQPGFYAAARQPKEIWKVPGAKHTGGLHAQPVEYERRVIAFFDRGLLGAK